MDRLPLSDGGDGRRPGRRRDQLERRPRAPCKSPQGSRRPQNPHSWNVPDRRSVLTGEARILIGGANPHPSPSAGARARSGTLRVEMARAPTTTASTLRLFVEALQAIGVDWRAVLRRCDVDPAVLTDPEARIPQERFERIWIAAREVSGDPCIGLHAGEHVHPHAVNLLGYLLLSSATLGAGVRRVCRYQLVLTADPWIGVEEIAGSVRVRVGTESGDPGFRAIHSEYVAALSLHLLDWVSE